MRLHTRQAYVFLLIVSLYSRVGIAQTIDCVDEDPWASINGLDNFVLNTSDASGSSGAYYQGSEVFELQTNAPVYLRITGQSLTQGATSLDTNYTIDGEEEFLATGNYGSYNGNHQIDASTQLGNISSQLAGQYTGTIVVTVMPQLPLLPRCPEEPPVNPEPGPPDLDITPPMLSPVPSTTVLWPPNHKLVDVLIAANVSDNSGSYLLAARVVSDQPLNGIGDGNTLADFTEPVIDQENGLIYLSLRSERSGKEGGRTYSIIIMAIDPSGNITESVVNIVAPKSR